ncbi:hypothetical protein [Sabulibacter ruber]|uniref:hypothetical protein n=1 Tax=Sabulibacter ruber TaxID=2811901 RepID=UPI001A96D6FE|nr:hypothetical protein [Sabulibacter ruber]
MPIATQASSSLFSMPASNATGISLATVFSISRTATQNITGWSVLFIVPPDDASMVYLSFEKTRLKKEAARQELQGKYDGFHLHSARLQTPYFPETEITFSLSDSSAYLRTIKSIV